MAKDILVGYRVNIDAVDGWLGSYGDEDSPDDISGGGFAGEIGVPRLLNLFRQKGDKMESQNYKIEEALIIPDINKK
ncbi:hypothetical protein HCMG_01100 [Helicobacter canadensis MIT 98-5491]|nr:hypothetical protein HCMG_01100 [Helicobacter canadensis MIT 98-5491]STP00044.1 polysaccharide deacetylase [Helicobacter canadensis]